MMEPVSANSTIIWCSIGFDLTLSGLRDDVHSDIQNVVRVLIDVRTKDTVGHGRGGALNSMEAAVGSATSSAMACASPEYKSEFFGPQRKPVVIRHIKSQQF